MIYVVVADTRTGSTAFRNGLKSDFCVIGEVLCATGWEDQDTNFFYWLNVVECKLMRLPLSKQEIRGLVEGWFSYLHAKFPDVRILLDVKYHDFHDLLACPRSVISCPDVLSYLFECYIPIIHLKRENKLEASLSGLVASKRGFFHSENEVSDNSLIYVEPGLAVADIQGRLDSEFLFDHWLHKYGGKIDIFYENMFNGNKLSSDTYNRLKDFFCFDFEFNTTNKKVISNVSSLVKNYEELRSRYEMMRLSCANR